MSDPQIERILADPQLAREILAGLKKGGATESLESTLSPAARLRSLMREEPGLEKIIRATGRPVLPVRNGTFEATTVERWRKRLEEARLLLERTIPSVGRVELRDDPDYKWAGTAWVVGDGLVVTNRHVAEIFARRDGAQLVFRRKGGGREVSASVDFIREHESEATFEIPIDDIVYLAPDSDDAPDVAVLRLKPGMGSLPPIALSTSEVEEGREIAVIGYPAYDYDEDSKLQNDLFGFYEVKRLAPGEVMGLGTSTVLTHDCSTLGGNSGSVLLDLETGQAVGLHYSGRSGKANYAVRASVVRDILDEVSRPSTIVPPPAAEEAPKPRIHSPAELAGRDGYDPHFLGIEVPVPRLTGDAESDLAKVANSKDDLLHYTHFSVAMSRSRRLARFTAVNIAGQELRRIVRKSDAWFLDGRLPIEVQAGDDVYAKNKLDRGHLVRRLDPVWGDDAARADQDTFHFTNACPQHEGLNQKTWLALEDYILENAGAHDLRVSVFTGPVLRETDRQYRSVQLPEEFWKVVVMRREPENELLATAYLLTQRHLLSDIEFVFGPFRTYQVPVKTIESLTSLDFRELRGHDPLAVSNERTGRPAKAIEGPEDLVLRKPAPTVDWAAIGAAFASAPKEAFDATRSALDQGETMPADVLGCALDVLKKECHFDVLIPLAELTGAFDADQPAVRKVACQGLIEGKQLDRAIKELQKARGFIRARLEAPPPAGAAGEAALRLQDRFELAEVEGLLGRVYKQRMIDTHNAAPEARAADARQSMTFYFDAYAAARIENLWHGINYVAVAHYARKNLAVAPPCDPPGTVAGELLRTLDQLESRGLMTDWHYATRGEAALALGDREFAAKSYAAYLARAGDHRFMRNSALRQLRELWQLPESDPLIELFAAPNAVPAAVRGSEPAAEQLQARHGDGGYDLPESDRDARRYARGVVRVSEDPWAGEGTGFIFDGAVISPRLAGKRLVLTCAHVCPEGVTPDRVTIIFFGEGKRDHVIVQFAEVIWTSGVDDLDASLLMIRGGADDAVPAPLARQAPQEGDDAFIVGHPLGGAKYLSRGKVTRVAEKRFFYGTETDQGLSGSPVFNGKWELTGLHRAGDPAANQGGRLDAIVKALRAVKW